MTCSLITPVIAFGKLAQFRPSEDPELFAFLLVGLITFVALTGVLALLARRVLAEPTHAPRRRRPLIPNAWGVARRIDPDAEPADSGSPPPAP